MVVRRTVDRGIPRKRRADLTAEECFDDVPSDEQLVALLDFATPC